MLQIQLLNAKDGWAVGEGPTSPRRVALLRTDDVGQTWRQAATRSVNSVCFGDAQYGWYSCDRDVFRTTDGGATWTPSFRNDVPTGGSSWVAEIACYGTDIAWTLFVDGAATSSQAYVMYRTIDGGVSWQPAIAAPIVQLPNVPKGDSYSGPFDVLDADVVYIVGTCPACAHSPTQSGTASISVTHDAGRTWQPTMNIPGAEFGPTDVNFADRDHGWLTTRGGIFATTDGGRTWTKQYPR